MMTFLMILVVVVLVVALVAVVHGAINGDMGCQFAFYFGGMGKVVELIGILVIAIINQNE